MAKNTQMANVAVNAEADALILLCNGGFVRVYGGPEPANADTALSGNTLLATLGLAATSAPAAVGGVITYNPLTAGVAVAGGTATFFRVFKSDGTTCVFQGNVATSDGNMVLAATLITSGASVTATSMTHTVAKNAASF
jgi:hypothetical protein